MHFALWWNEEMIQLLHWLINYIETKLSHLSSYLLVINSWNFGYLRITDTIYYSAHRSRAYSFRTLEAFTTSTTPGTLGKLS